METAVAGLPSLGHDIDIVPYREMFREDIARLWDSNFRNADRESYRRDIDLSLRSNPGLFWIAVRGNTLAGTCLGASDGHRTRIYYLCVAPQYRRQGIGTRLLRHVEGLLVAAGARQVGLYVDRRREGAMKFYRARGYFAEDIYCMGKRLG